ncbi:MAG: PEP-CTERM sorting domain-containing protein [Nitrospirota bacterium]|jgi:hypothetical protein
MKFLRTLLTAAVMSTVALGSTASAAPWDKVNLALAVYNAADNQAMVDLFDTQTYDVTQQNVELKPAGTVNLGQFPTINDWADLRMGAFGGLVDINNLIVDIWFVTTNFLAPPPVSDGSILGFDSMNELTKNAAGNADPGDTGVSVLSSADPNSYSNKANSNGNTPGQYGGYNADFAAGEAMLAALDVPGGFQDMYLYHFQFDTGVGASVPVLGATTPYSAVLRLNQDGSVILNPAAVPEPTSFALIGSAIIGLVGLRRKLSA